MMRRNYLNLIRLVYTLIVIATASVCSGSSASSEYEKRLAVFQNQFPHRTAFVVYVETTNFFTDKIRLVALRAGENSASVDAIVSQLSAPATPWVVVTGGDDGLAAATLERALISGRGKIVSGRTVTFVGSTEYRDSLAKVALDSGVLLDFVSYPAQETNKRVDPRPLGNPTLFLSGVGENTKQESIPGYPDRVKSNQFNVVNAGILVFESSPRPILKLLFQINLNEAFPKKVYSRATIVGVDDALPPIIYEGDIASELSTRVAHGPIEGLTIGKQFKVKFEFFEDAGRAQRIGEIEQLIISTISNTDGCLSLAPALKERDTILRNPLNSRLNWCIKQPEAV